MFRNEKYEILILFSLINMQHLQIFLYVAQKSFDLSCESCKQLIWHMYNFNLLRKLVNMIYDSDKSFITSFIGRDERPLRLSKELLEWQAKYLFFGSITSSGLSISALELKLRVFIFLICCNNFMTMSVVKINLESWKHISIIH